MVGNARLQRVHDAPGECFQLVGRDPVDGCLGVNAGAEESLVGVDVANAGKRALVEQGRLDGHGAVAEGLAKGSPVKGVAQGFGSEIPKDGGQVGLV